MQRTLMVKQTLKAKVNKTQVTRVLQKALCRRAEDSFLCLINVHACLRTFGTFVEGQEMIIDVT